MQEQTSQVRCSGSMGRQGILFAIEFEPQPPEANAIHAARKSWHYRGVVELDKAFCGGMDQLPVSEKAIARTSPLKNADPCRIAVVVLTDAFENSLDLRHAFKDPYQRVVNGSFRKFGVPYFRVLIIRILLFRVLY